MKPLSYAPAVTPTSGALNKQGVLVAVHELPQAEVLIIEDELLMSALMQRYLKTLNYSDFGPTRKRSGPVKSLHMESGWELLNADLSHIKVAIVDILLPQVNGVDLLRDFKKRYPNMGLVPISGMATEPMKRNLRELLPEGFDLINKPLRREEFLENFKKAWAFSQGDRSNVIPITRSPIISGEDPVWTEGVSKSKPLEVLKKRKLPKQAA